MHLTNYAINKENPNFMYQSYKKIYIYIYLIRFNKNSDHMNIGHKRSFSSILTLLK